MRSRGWLGAFLVAASMSCPADDAGALVVCQKGKRVRLRAADCEKREREVPLDADTLGGMAIPDLRASLLPSACMDADLSSAKAIGIAPDVVRLSGIGTGGRRSVMDLTWSGRRRRIPPLAEGRGVGDAGSRRRAVRHRRR